MGEFVLSEAKRCLQCKKPLCKEGCPVSTPVNEIVKMLLEGQIEEAGEKLFKNNPLSIVCSLICPHSKQCEGHCVLGKKGNAIQVSHIENYISDYYLNLIPTKYEIDKNKKVAIIGSGPAGITIAFILASKGYDITIFEAHDKIGGVLQYGIPEFRLPKEILYKIKEKLLNMGIKIRPNTLIGPTITIDDLFRDGYKAVFIGTGVWKPRGLSIKGETLGNVHFAIDYLKNPDVYNLGKKVCIIGAGNVAMDVARTALRKGSREVIVIFRAGEEHVEADKVEVEYAKLDGVKFSYYSQPLEIIDNGIRVIKTEIKKAEDGIDTVYGIEGSEEFIESDSVVIAIGQGPRTNIVSSTKGIEVNNRGLLATDSTGKTSREGVFASGDVVTGAKTVVEAVKVSKLVAEEIDRYVNSL
ncbi:MAG: NAD(P)-dependent oxidoreductase [Fusobacteriaceae bacterium]|nr:NAD(P)-dependent oxidoreductase [Fusobacteriaceae bacterium]MBN2837514.1 NAD(P)-dependent oxidoreductase [Fusobacteriaceae bacterium]